MIPTISPNRVFLLAVSAFLMYWVLAIFYTGPQLREVFNSMRLGFAIVITATWLRPAWRSTIEEAGEGEWQLVVAIFFLWLVVTLLGFYAIAFDLAGRPESWSNSAIAGFFPYSFFISALLFLIAPGVRKEGLKTATVWWLVTAAAIGAFIAGMLTMASISTV